MLFLLYMTSADRLEKKKNAHAQQYQWLVVVMLGDKQRRFVDRTRPNCQN